jgi:hypothetical protein
MSTFRLSCLSLFFIFCRTIAIAQSSDDFTGFWAGYLKVDGSPAYCVYMNASPQGAKAITVHLSYYNYGKPESLKLREIVEMTYDKQQRIAYCNRDIPATGGKVCTGYIILKMDKNKSGYLECKLKVNKDCMIGELLMARSDIIIKDPVFIAGLGTKPDKATEGQTTKINVPCPNQPAFSLITDNIYDCELLLKQTQDAALKSNLQKNYLILLGIVSDLSAYRDQFLKDGSLINLFPTAYYHTTKNEMLKILSGAYKYPNEKMLQMISFYDAYKFNRENWDNQNKEKVEKHWKEHFEFATSDQGLNLGCAKPGQVLATAIVAHVKVDLARAIRYAYRNDQTSSAIPSSLVCDFLGSNDLFEKTQQSTLEDLVKARSDCYSWMMQHQEKEIALSNAIYKMNQNIGDLMEWKEILTKGDVITLRQKAFELAFQNEPLQGWPGYALLGQPLTNHDKLESKGRSLCGATPANNPVQPAGKTFTINPGDITQAGDKAFKWYEWPNAPEDLKTAAGYIVCYTNRQTNKPVTLLETINRYVDGAKCTLRIAAIDLNGNGIAGLAISASGMNCCGTAGCTYMAYEDGGISYQDISAHGEADPANGGIKGDGSTNLFVNNQYFLNNYAAADTARKLFHYDVSKLVVNRPKRPAGQLLTGANNAEELGKLIVKALKTNDKKLWMSLIHPDIGYTPPYDVPGILDDYAKGFDRARNYFESKGLAHWERVTFSIVTFDYNSKGNIINLHTEFYYEGKDFVGMLEYGEARKYQAKFMLIGIPTIYGFERNISRR